jgi:hypothetical protein
MSLPQQAHAQTAGRPRRWRLILVAGLVIALAVGGGGVLLTATSFQQLDAASRSAQALAPDGNAAAVRLFHDIAGGGFMGEQGQMARLPGVLQALTDAGDSDLDSAVALSTLEWAGRAANALTNEKLQVKSVAAPEASRALQQSVAAMYDAHEQVFQQLAAMTVDWNSHFGDDRRQRIQDVDDAAQSRVAAHADMLAALSAEMRRLDDILGEQAERRQALQAEASSRQTLAYLGVVAVALGALAAAGALAALAAGGRRRAG